jgi:hypothetical protein
MLCQNQTMVASVSQAQDLWILCRSACLLQPTRVLPKDVLLVVFNRQIVSYRSAVRSAWLLLKL